MIEQLFGSKTRVKLLNLFYSNPNRSFYVREITRKIDEQINSVRRELANLLSIGIIVSDTNNNRLYYEVNQKYNFYDPLLAIFGSKSRLIKDIESSKDVRTLSATENSGNQNDRLKLLGHIELVFYTGQFTRDDTSGVDMLIVGDVNQNALQKYVSELENREGKEIRYALMPRSEFEYRRQIKDRFLTNALDSKKQILVDEIGILGN